MSRRGKKGSKPRRVPSPRVAAAERAAERTKAAAAPAPTRPRFDDLFLALTGLSVVLLAVRFYAANTVGFGDSEALYVTYGLHPQPAYLDHPGLVGSFAAALKGEGAPAPEDVHRITAVLATMAPWIVSIVAKNLGATARAGYVAAIVCACAPMLGIGLFALTPDLLLFHAWLATVGLAASALEAFPIQAPGSKRAPPPSSRFAALALGAGLFAGIAAASKISGLLLFPALAWAYASSPARRSPWPWMGLALGLLPLWPIAGWEIGHGFPMLHHRFVDTQGEAGFSLRNLGALFGGQLLYVSPVLAVVAGFVARDLVRRRAEDLVTGLLYRVFVVSIGPLVLLMLWSRVAEPHWLAPALLVLPIHGARKLVPFGDDANAQGNRWRKITIAGAAIGLAMTAAVHAWILIPSAPSLAPKSMDTKLDISNELFGWRDAIEQARELEADLSVDGSTVTIASTTWMQCAQLAAQLPKHDIGCATDRPSDFDDWNPRSEWEKSDRVILVTDNRFEVDAAKVLATHAPPRVERVTVFRGGKLARAFRLTVLEKRAIGSW